MSAVDTSKSLSELDADQIVKKVYNSADASISVNGFLVSRVNNRVTLTITTTTVSNDTQVFNFYQDLTTLLYTITLIYTDNSYATLISATRTA